MFEGEMFLLLVLAGGLLGLFIHMALAGAAAGRKGFAAWGLFGPAGVIVAGFKGLHARIEELEAQRKREKIEAKRAADRERIEREQSPGLLD